MIQTIRNAWSVPELRKKILFTIFALLIFRLDVYKRQPVLKLLKSAAANAENNHQMDPEKLYVSACYANPGPIIKRIMPRAQGRAYRINKRTSHVTIVVSER